MKQCDIVIGGTYRLVRMQHQPRLRPELNGEIVRIVRQKQRMRQGTNFAGFKTGGSHKSNIVYLTSIGVRVGATNLEEVGE